MILLDSDHFTALNVPDHASQARLASRLQSSPDKEIALPLFVAEESLRGWLAGIAKAKTADQELFAYLRLAALLGIFREWRFALPDKDSFLLLDGLRKSRIRIGTPDLKIAAIAIQRDALLLTANKKDFGKVPGLRFENWLA